MKETVNVVMGRKAAGRKCREMTFPVYKEDVEFLRNVVAMLNEVCPSDRWFVREEDVKIDGSVARSKRRVFQVNWDRLNQVPLPTVDPPKLKWYKVEVVYRKGVDVGKVKSGYAYSTDIEGLEVGDVVEVPGIWVNQSYPQTATVVRIGSDYKGNCSGILRLLEKANVIAR